MPLLEHAQQRAGGGPADPDVEVLDGVWALRVVEEDPSLEGQALAGRVGDGVAQPGVPQERGGGEGVRPVQRDLVLVGFGHVRVDALLITRPPAPMSLRPGQTRMVWGMLVVAGPAGGARRRLSLTLILMRWACEITRLTSASPLLGNRAT